MSLWRRLMEVPSNMVTYAVVILGIVPIFVFIMKVLNRTEVLNKKVLQRAKPPFLFVSNHVSMLDDAFVGPLVFLPRALWDFRFIPYHAPERKNFFRGPIFSTLMYAAKCVPFTRGMGVFQPGMEQLIRLLKRGNTVHIYPEGTRTRTGEIGKGKIGVGRLVRETGARVIPCYHSGLDKILPIGHKIPRIGHRARILIGEVLNFSEFMNLPNAPKTWQTISDRIIDAIRELRSKMEGENAESRPRVEDTRKLKLTDPVETQTAEVARNQAGKDETKN